MIPVIKTNNRKIKKEAIVDGVSMEVEIPAEKQFTMFEKPDKDLVVSNYGDSLRGTILCIKYIIKSRHGITPAYQSTEFDYTDNGKNLVVYSVGEKRDKLFEGSIKDAGEMFSTGEKNKYGKFITTYDTIAHVYLLDKKDDTPERKILKFKWKLNGACNLFDYLETFKNEEVNASGVITDFVLEKAVVGENSFWKVIAKRGEVDEDKDLITDSMFKVAELSKSQPVKKREETPYSKAIGNDEEEIEVDKIPF